MSEERNNNERQKISISFFFINEKNEEELFGKWTVEAGKKYIIGRKNADINIDYQLLSKKHIEMTYYTNNYITIKDLYSRNGTFINNNRIKENQEIRFTSKDKISLGNTNNKLIFQENQNQILKEPVIPKKQEYNLNKNISDAQTEKNIKNDEERERNKNDPINQRYKAKSNSHSKTQSKFHRRDIYTDNLNNSFSNKYNKYKNNNDYNEEDIIKVLRNYKKYSNDKLVKDKIEKENNQYEYLGKKIARNSNDEENQIKKFNQLDKTKKIGLEKLKRKIDGIDDSDKSEINEQEINIKKDELIFPNMGKLNRNEKIVLKTNKFIEFNVPIKFKNLKNNRRVKSIKYITQGYLVLNVKHKKFIYE